MLEVKIRSNRNGYRYDRVIFFFHTPKKKTKTKTKLSTFERVVKFVSKYFKNVGPCISSK